MELEIEVWLRGSDSASTEVVSATMAEPTAWTDDDVRVLLEELLRAIERGRNPGADRHRPVWLRGFSWIVSPFESGGVTLAVEIQLGAAAAGPFAIDQQQLEHMVTRVLRDARASGGAGAATVH
jgi:hypothetical protein